MSNIQALPTTHAPRQTYLVLAVGLLASSTAAILIRLAQGADIPSLFIATARLSIATLILTPIILRNYRGHIQQLARRDFLLIGLSGLFLAIHFITWITSLELTSVLISVVMVSTAPLWIALLEHFLLQSRLSRPILVGLLVAMAGGIIISLPGGEAQISLGSNPVLGSLMALTGAFTIAVYLVIGRSVRNKLPLLPYIWLVYGIAALITLIIVLLTATPVTGYPPQGYLWVLAVALVPQLIGHSSFNYVLRYLPATLVGVIGQLEPVGSATMAMVLFHEIPRPLQLIGSAIILVGVILAILGQQDGS